MARAVRRSPELKAGWPQQDCNGTATVQPASSRSLTAANPTEGRIRSTRQVTKSPTRLSAFSVICPLSSVLWSRKDFVAFARYKPAMAIVKWVLISGVSGYALLVGLLYVSQRAMLYHPIATHMRPAEAGLPEAQEVVLDTSDGEKVIVWHVPPRGDKPVVIYFHGNAEIVAWRVDRHRALIAN